MVGLKRNGGFLCLSAVLLALGTYLSTLETAVWIGSETDLMHIYSLFFSFPLWIVSALLLVIGVASGLRRHSASLQPRKPFISVDLVVAVALGALIFASVFLPWVNVEVVNPTIGRPGIGSFSVEPHQVLAGVSLPSANYWEGDVMYLMFVGTVTALLYLPLVALFERQNATSLKAILLVLSGVCTMFPAVSVWAIERWFIKVSFGGGGGSLTATPTGPGGGLIIAGVSATALMVLGILVGFRSIRGRSNSEDWRTVGGLETTQ